MNDQSLKPVTYACEPLPKWSFGKSRAPNHKKKSVKNKRSFCEKHWQDQVLNTALQPWI